MPEPDNNPKKDSTLKDFARAESMIQLAIVMPGACVIGWFLGSLLDRHFHTHWIYVVGVLLGAAGGFIQMYRVAAGYMRKN